MVYTYLRQAPAWTSHQLAADDVDKVRYRFGGSCEGIRDSHDHRSGFAYPLRHSAHPFLGTTPPTTERLQRDSWGCFAYGVGGILMSKKSLLGDGFLHAIMWLGREQNAVTLLRASTRSLSFRISAARARCLG